MIKQTREAMEVTIEVVRGDDCEAVLPLIEKLLVELGEEGDELGELDRHKVIRIWQETPGAVAFVAYIGDNEVAGFATVVECFAVYANGNYGVINEMYVEPHFRSQGIGVKLVEAVARWGKERDWKRIDVTAPESERWLRSKHFYEKLGFAFTGPKLKLIL